MWLFQPRLDTRKLELFLEHQGIMGCWRELVVEYVIGAVREYWEYSERCKLRDDLENVLEAAEKIKKAIPKFGTARFVQLYEALAKNISVSAHSPAIKKRMPIFAYQSFLFDERSSSLHGIENHLQNIILGATEALKALSKSRNRPRTPERIFVDTLAEGWIVTKNKPTFSGKMKFENPSTPFAKFVKISSELTGAQENFREGFVDMIRRTCNEMAKIRDFIRQENFKKGLADMPRRKFQS